MELVPPPVDHAAWAIGCLITAIVCFGLSHIFHRLDRAAMDRWDSTAEEFYVSLTVISIIVCVGCIIATIINLLIL